MMLHKQWENRSLSSSGQHAAIKRERLRLKMMGEEWLLMEERKNEEFGVTMIKHRHDPHAKICCRGHPVVVRLIRGLCGSPLQARLSPSFPLSLSLSLTLIIDAIWPAGLAAWHRTSATPSSEASSGSAVPPSPGTEPAGVGGEQRGVRRRSRGGNHQSTYAILLLLWCISVELFIRYWILFIFIE